MNVEEEDLIAPVRVLVSKEVDVLVASQKARALAEKLDMSKRDLSAVQTAVSEVARNIVDHAGQGMVVLRLVRRGERRGLRVVASDQGPGIPDVEEAIQDGYSTGSGLGMGLSGARRLMDDFDLTSTVEEGTMVMMTKWEHGT